VGLLEQEPQLDATKDVRGNIEDGVAHVKQLLERFNELSMNYSDETADEFARVQEQIDATDGWNLDTTLEIAMDALRTPPGDAEVSTLSGGERRRVALARLLLSQPDLLLLDEPTVGLDPLAAADIRRLLRDTMAGRTVLMSTHNLAEAEELCDTVIIVRRGRILIHERIEQLRRQSAPRVHLVARQGKEALADAAEGLKLTWSPNGAGIWLELDEPDREVPDVLRRLLSDGIDVFECHLVAPTLEDLFVDLVRRT
jgi:ABC-type multidrug transport system ATPase subunit